MRFIAVAAVVLTATLAIPSPTHASGTCPGDTTPNFTDNCYHEYILYNVDQPEVDALILPSADPYILRENIVLKQSIEAWDAGINAKAPAWLASGLNIHAYNLGLDPAPVEALWDPEIIVVSAEVNPVLLAGIGEQVPISICHGIPPPGLDAQLGTPDFVREAMALPGWHQHAGNSWGMVSAQCQDGGSQCFVINTNFLDLPTAGNRRDMYDLNSHEFGHCLGIGHVGDALDFTASSYPWDDIMSYENDGHDAGRVLCVSTLNILALEQVYGDLLGQSGYPSDPAGGYVHQDPSAWNDDQDPSTAGNQLCPEPTASYLDTSTVTNADPLGLGTGNSGSPPHSGPLEQAGGWNRPVGHGCDATYGQVNPNTCTTVKQNEPVDDAVDPQDEGLAAILCLLAPGSPPELGC